MDISLLKKLGNAEQLAGVREAQLLHGRGQGTRIAEFYNAAGLRFTLMPDRCMDLYDLSYRGVNLSFLSKNGVTSPLWCTTGGAFVEQWPGGMLATCGPDNVGGGCSIDGEHPTHGRISATPASRFGVDARWEGDEYLLRADGEMDLTRLYGYHYSLRRSVTTSLNSRQVHIHDVLTNLDEREQPCMLLYHCNIGYPLLDDKSRALFASGEIVQTKGEPTDPHTMSAPVDGKGEALFLHGKMPAEGCAVMVNDRLELGLYVRFNAATLPEMLQWKKMKSHDYVAAFEPCNTHGLNRKAASEQGLLPTLQPYESIETDLTIGVLDGAQDIADFIARCGCR